MVVSQQNDTSLTDSSIYSLFDVIETDEGVQLKMGNKNLLQVNEQANGVEIKVNEKSFFKVTESKNGMKIQTSGKAIYDTVKKYSEHLSESNVEAMMNASMQQLGKRIDEQMQGISANMNADEEMSNQNQKKISDTTEIVEDSTQVRIGDLEINVIENEKGSTRVDISRKNDKKEEEEKEKTFEGNWGGLEIGMNGFLNKDYAFGVPDDAGYLDIHTGKSINFNLNFPSLSIGIIGRQFGLVTGIGLEWMNFRFENLTTITVNDHGDIGLDTTAPPNIEKSKLTTLYLTAPLLLEVQFPDPQKAYFQVGVIGALKLGSHTKIVHRDDGDKDKDKDRGDFNLLPLRYGVTTRIGYEKLGIYMNYYPVSLFEKGNGPKIYVYAAGLRVSF
jgi:hypothetical protein